MEATLKQRFLQAVIEGELGQLNDLGGATVTLREFRRYFSDVDFNYAGSFLPGAVIETGQRTPTHTRFVFRLKRGVYLVHPDTIRDYRIEQSLATE